MSEEVGSVEGPIKNRLAQYSLWVLGATMVGFAFWFGMLYPLIPTTLMGWVIEVVAGVIVAVWAMASILMIGWLQRQKRNRVLFRLVAFGVSISLGAGIFWISVYSQTWIVANFSYFGR